MIAINAFAVNGVMPDLTILLDVTIDQGFERLAARNKAQGKELDRMERAGSAFHESVRQGYLALAARWPQRFARVDSSPDEDTVAAAVWTVTEALLDRQQAQ